MPIGTNELEHAQKIVGAASLIEWETCTTRADESGMGAGWEPFAAYSLTYSERSTAFEDSYTASHAVIVWRRPKLVLPKDGF